MNIEDLAARYRTARLELKLIQQEWHRADAARDSAENSENAKRSELEDLAKQLLAAAAGPSPDVSADVPLAAGEAL